MYTSCLPTIKKILEKNSDHFSSFHSEQTQARDYFSEKIFIGLC